MNNYKLIIQYDGRKYNGWQKQGNTDNTIQGILEDIISRYFSKNESPNIIIEVNGSGRTDAGVSAYRQVANLKINDFFETNSLLDYLNNELPKDIRIISVEKVDEYFHARLSSTGKYYSFYIDNGAVPNVFKRNYSYRVETPLNINEMKKATLFLKGEHDFTSFCTKSNTKKSMIRTIYDINITETNGIIRICYHGNGFLYNMIRILSGTLIEIGQGKRSPNDINEILANKDRAFAGPTVPPNALFLDLVEY